MLALIGGMMLSCAVGAMILLAMWSLARDEDPDAMPRDGILALRDWSARTVQRAERKQRKPRKTAPMRSHGRRHAAATSRKVRLDFDRQEMDEIAREIEEDEAFRDVFGGETA